MKISVIIPVYNVERYLARCLDSVLAAVRELESVDGGGRRAVEIICVNDGSTDGSEAILERYRSSFLIPHSSFFVLTQPNGGLGAARNTGLEVMTGDYVMFVDSDDWIPPHALMTFAAVAEASKARLVVSMSFLKDSDAATVHLSAFDLQSPAWRLRPSPWISGKKVQYCAWNKFYSADLFAKRRYPATIYEDFPVTTDILCEVGEFAAVDEPLYVYCTNAGATSLVRSSYSERKLDDSIAVVRQTLDVARRQVDPRMAAFALHQAANGHSSTVGQVWKAKDAALREKFMSGHSRLLEDYPEMKGRLSAKAAFRLWRMRRA